MSAPLREAARLLYDLRTNEGWEAVESVLETCSDDEVAQLTNCWHLWARPGQLRPTAGLPIWLRLAGRGEGKTRSAAEERLDLVEDWGSSYRGMLASKTISDVRDVMIHGESGLIECARRRGHSVRYVANRKIVEFWNGGIAAVFSSEKPDGPRGYQGNDLWGDEVSSWMSPIDFLNNLLKALRLPSPDGRVLPSTFTTTPKANPITFLLARSPQFESKVMITGGKTRDNAENLAEGQVEFLESLYKGTRIGRQELDGELLATLGAIVDQDTIHKHRVRRLPEEIGRKIVSLDPSITADEDSDAAGIVVLASDTQSPPDAYIVDDRTLETATFRQWARATVLAFVEHDCDCVVAEINQGGGGIVEAIQAEAEHLSKELGREVVVPVRSIWARESKRSRAEPVGTLYERGRVHHVGIFEHVEREFTQWVPGMASPNRMDAVVHGVAHLLLGDKQVGDLSGYL